MAITTLQFLGVVALLATAYLLREFAKNLTKGAVDEHVGKVLAEHRHAFELHLEDHRSQLSRDMQAIRQGLDQQLEQFSRDYGLFAERRNTVYADLYARLERARGAYGNAMAVMRIGPQFDRAQLEDIAAYAETEEHFIPSEKSAIRQACADGNVDSARRLAAGLEDTALRRRADATFRDWKNEWICQTLYLSTAVESALGACNQTMAAMSAELLVRSADERVNWERRRQLVTALDLATGEVRRAMKREITSSFTPAIHQLTVSEGEEGTAGKFLKSPARDA